MRIDGTVLQVAPGDIDALRSLEQQFGRLRHPRVVVYMPVGTKKGIATIRFESSAGEKAYSKTLVRVSSLDRRGLIDLEAQAAEVLGNTARSRLQSELLPADRSGDRDRTVFFVDNAYYGLIPVALDLEDGAVLSSLDITAALKSLDFLKKTRMEPTDFTAFFGYPETQKDIEAIFGSEKTADIATWKERISEVRKLSEDFKFKVYGSPELNRFKTKEDVLAAIENSTGIIWVTAHSSKCRVRLSAGEAVEISADDIAALRLSKHPFVIVRACNGNEAGFARAFVSAGASAVWVNQGKILASEVNSELREFLSAADQGTIADAIRAVKANSRRATNGTALHVELMGRDNGHEAKN